MRCFVAIDLPDEVKVALGRTQAALRDGAPQADVRWTAAPGLHVTLQFLGEVPEATAPAVADPLTRAAAGCPRLALGCQDSLPSRRPPGRASSSR